MQTSRRHVASVLLSLGMAALSVHAEIQIEEIIIDGPQQGRPPSRINVPPPSRGGSTTAAPIAPTGYGDHLEFLNKDKLHGGLVSAKPEAFGIKWKHHDIDNPIDFDLKTLSRITLEPRARANAQPPATTVELTNHDLIRGNIVSLDPENLILDTDYAGRMTIKRVMLQGIHPNTTASFILYEGPKDFAKWTTPRHSGGKSWDFKKGALYALQSYPIGRNIDKLPDVGSIEFDVAWRNYPQLYFAFYTDNIQQYYGNCYMLQVSSSSVNLQSYTRNGSQRNLGNVSLSRFSSGKPGHARFRILVDKKKKTIALLIDGNLVKQWEDPNDFSGKGNGILFQPQTQGGLKISNIRITRWNGKIPQATESTPSQKEDLVRFANNDKVSGHLNSIADGNLKFKTSYAMLDIPLNRVLEISLSSDASERARRNKHDIRAHFVGEGNVTLQLTGIVDSKLTGQSENFGHMTVPIHTLRLLEFNIYEEKEDNADDGFTF